MAIIPALALFTAATVVGATPPRTVGFRESARVDIGHAPVALAVGDLDGDGRPDVMVANEDSTLTRLLGDVSGSLGAPTDFFGGTDVADVALSDLDQDGALDLVVSSPRSGRVFTFPGDGDGGFLLTHVLQGPWSPGPLAPLAASGGDLVVADLFFQALVVAVNDGNGSFHFGDQVVGFVDPVSIAVGDVDGNGSPDVAVADASSHVATVVTNLGQAGRRRHDQPLAGRPVAIAMGDLDRDGHDDLVVATQSPGMLAVCRGAADGSIGPAHTDPAGSAPVALVLGDFDGDGRLDAAVADSAERQISVWLGRGDGTFNQLGSIPTGAGPVALALADMNGDGWPDLVCANHDDGTVQVLLNTSTLAAGTVHLYPPTPNPASTTSQITFALSVSMTVRLDVYDLAGRFVRTLVDGRVMPAGPHVVSWDGRTDAGHVARSGVYLARLRAGGAEATTRLVLQR